jgi:hypothetical protein
MSDFIVVNSCDEAQVEFVRLIEEKDFDGALGVAQVLWALCPNMWAFQIRRSDLLGELSTRHPCSPLAEVQYLGRQILGLKFDQEDETFAWAA